MIYLLTSIFLLQLDLTKLVVGLEEFYLYRPIEISHDEADCFVLVAGLNLKSFIRGIGIHFLKLVYVVQHPYLYHLSKLVQVILDQLL